MDSGGGGGDAFAPPTAPLTWHDFLERMKHPSAADFVKSIKSFIVSFSNRAPNPEKDSASLQEFLSNMEVAFKAHPLWAGRSEEELDSAGEGLEKYVMTKLYNRAFASMPEEVKRDEDLHEKMALLQLFIRPENLDIKPAFQNETSWLLAQKELQKINMHKAPRDKLFCILNCCKVINNLLLNASLSSNDNPPGADEFLPILIYVTLKANPPRLHSNLLYIQRYRRQSRLVSEAAYYFTNILSAESFIWNINAESLSMDEVEFQKNMESARAVLLGIDGEVHSNQISQEERRPTLSDTGDNRSERLESSGIQSVNIQSSHHKASVSQDEKNRSTASSMSASDFEAKGAAVLAKDEQRGRYFHEYPFLFSQAGDLTVSDVEILLASYKELVVKYVALSKGLSIITASPPKTDKPSEPVLGIADASRSPSSDFLSGIEHSKETDETPYKETSTESLTEALKDVDASVVAPSQEVDSGVYNLLQMEESLI